MRELLGYLAYRAGTAAVGWLPARLVAPLGRAAGRLAWLWAGPRKRMALRHMRRVLGPDPQLEAAAREVFANYGRYWAEVFWVRPRRVEELMARMEVEGLEHVRRAKREGRGMVLALPHLGNWEVAGPIAVEEGLELMAVAEALPNRRVTSWFVELRRMLGIEVVLAGGGSDTMRALLGCLERGGAVALVSDRDVTGGGVPVAFFGEATTLPAGPVVLAHRSGAVVLPVAVYFRPGVGHRAVVRPPLALPGHGDREDRVAGGMQRVAESLEELIRAEPTQWHLVQPNWPSDREA